MLPLSVNSSLDLARDHIDDLRSEAARRRPASRVRKPLRARSRAATLLLHHAGRG